MITNYPQGISSFGVPQIGNGGAGIPFIPITTGRYWWVSNVSGQNGSDAAGPNGMAPASPFKTLAYALTQVTQPASTQTYDVIIVMPGHAETISTATQMNISQNNVSIVGLGVGSLRPTFTWSTTAATWTISGNNVSLSNLLFQPTGVTAVVTPFTLSSSAGGIQFRNCECYFAIAATAIATCGFVTASTAAAANNLLIDGCYIHGDAAATLSSAGAITLVGGDYVQITNNFIYGKFAGAAGVAGNPITNQTTAGTRWFIGNNVLVNLGATNAGNMAIAIIATTGAIVNNRLFALGATVVPVTATAIEVLAGNYWAGTVDTAGALS